jgi:hypothetical protein
MSASSSTTRIFIVSSPMRRSGSRAEAAESSARVSACRCTTRSSSIEQANAIAATATATTSALPPPSQDPRPIDGEVVREASDAGSVPVPPGRG